MSIQISDKAFGAIVGLGVPALLALAVWNPSGLVMAAAAAIAFVVIVQAVSWAKPSHL